jgi:peptide/nickel transport system permease protein
MVGLAHLDFGLSIQTQQPVAQDIATYLPRTVELVVAAFVLYVLLGTGIGIIWAVWPRGIHAVLFRLLTVAGVAVPVFWLGLIFQLVFGAYLHWLPIAGAMDYSAYGVARVTGIDVIDALLAGNLSAVGDALAHLALPALTLMLGQLAVAASLTRASLKTQLEEAYVRTARARGVRDRHIVLVDALRNAMNPVIAMLGVQLGFMMGGTVIVEAVFSWPGLGLYAYNAFQSFDYNAITAVTIVITVTFVVVNTLVSAIYPMLDPRLREPR